MHIIILDNNVVDSLVVDLHLVDGKEVANIHAVGALLEVGHSYRYASSHTAYIHIHIILLLIFVLDKILEPRKVEGVLLSWFCI